MLWFSERTWVHHYVSFVLMLSAAAMIVSDPEEPERSQQLVYRSAGIFFALTLFASEAGKIFGRDGIDWVKAYGVYLVGSMIMTVAVLRAGAARRRRSKTLTQLEISDFRKSPSRPRAALEGLDGCDLPPGGAVNLRFLDFVALVEQVVPIEQQVDAARPT